MFGVDERTLHLVFTGPNYDESDSHPPSCRVEGVGRTSTVKSKYKM